MSIIPLYFINLAMAQASTAGTAILRAKRNEGNLFPLTDSIRFRR
jgi:hypothetical protein